MQERIGIILVSDLLLFDLKESKEINRCFELVEFVPEKKVYDPIRGVYKFKGTSPSFREVKDGDNIPEYMIEVTQWDTKGINQIKLLELNS